MTPSSRMTPQLRDPPKNLKIENSRCPPPRAYFFSFPTYEHFRPVNIAPLISLIAVRLDSPVVCERELQDLFIYWGITCHTSKKTSKQLSLNALSKFALFCVLSISVHFAQNHWHWFMKSTAKPLLLKRRPTAHNATSLCVKKTTHFTKSLFFRRERLASLSDKLRTPSIFWCQKSRTLLP